MKLTKASRKKVKIKMQIGGTSGSGKSYGALKIAYGLCNDWNKIAVIDTENGSSSLYVGKDGIGEFNTIILNSFTERDYIQAIELCEKSGIEVCIIDTSSRLWDYLIELQTKLGGRYQDWKEPKEKHKKYLYKMLEANMHVISTVRKKEEYVIEQQDKKTEIKKVGLKDQQEANMSYEFTVVLDVDNQSHLASSAKDRTGLFDGQMPFLITEETGKKIADWCNDGIAQKKEVVVVDGMLLLKDAKTKEEMLRIVKEYPELKESDDFKVLFKQKQEELTEQK